LDLEDGRALPNFLKQALLQEELTVFGDGQQTRSFCYVDDLVEGLILMMNGPDDFIGPVNLGNPAECSILELAAKVIELTGSASKIQFHKQPQDDPRRRRPDIRLAKERLGWQPGTDLATGLGHTIGYFHALMPTPSEGRKTGAGS
jgi:UDP-glucuronate decarboxylase